MSRAFFSSAQSKRSPLAEPRTGPRSLRLIAPALLVVCAHTVHAQTDYYNTDRGRPVQIEDAYVTERYAFELKLAPVKLERERGGVYNWGVEPEIAYGIFPRTQIEIGLPLVYREAGPQRTSGIAGLEFSIGGLCARDAAVLGAVLESFGDEVRTQHEADRDDLQQHAFPGCERAEPQARPVRQ